MGMYTNLESDVYSVFSSAGWLAENIKTYPSNFLAISPGNQYIKISIIPSGSWVNRVSKSGVIIIDIYTPAGGGPRAASLIADKLDQYLANKTVSTANNASTQFGQSSLSHLGNDRDNVALYRSSYTIPFNYFGVL